MRRIELDIHHASLCTDDFSNPVGEVRLRLQLLEFIFGHATSTSTVQFPDAIRILINKVPLQSSVLYFCGSEERVGS